MKVLVTCNGCSLLLRFHWLRRMVSVSSLEERDTLISLGLLSCFPIHIEFAIEADTPMYWLWLDSGCFLFFWHVLLLSLTQELQEQIQELARGGAQTG